MSKQVPPEFYELADQFIALANRLSRESSVERISAVLLFAAARFNAHCLFATDPDARRNRAAAVSYFVDQYRSMLEDNIGEFGQAGAGESNE